MSIGIIVMQIVDNNPLDPFAPKHDTIYIMDHDIIEGNSDLRLSLYQTIVLLHLVHLNTRVTSATISESRASSSETGGILVENNVAFILDELNDGSEYNTN